MRVAAVMIDQSMPWSEEENTCSPTWMGRICGLRVVTLQGDRLSLGRAIGRFFARLLSFFILCIGVIMVALAPVLLINPDRIYDTLLTPSLFALWLSELVTFAVYAAAKAYVLRLDG